MQVKLEKQEGLSLRLTITVPTSEVEEKIEARLKDVAKNAKIDGFRPGKVPFNVVKQRYSEAVQGEILPQLIETSYINALKQENITPAGYPKIDMKPYVAGAPFEFTVDFEVYPEIELKGFDGLEIEQFKSDVNETDIEKVIEDLRKQQAKWNKVDRVAKDGDKVIIDFDGFMGEEPIKNGKAEKMDLVLGSKSMIPGFEDAFMGKKEGDEFSFDIKFPKDYQNKDYADKDALFKVRVYEVLEPSLPELNDELAEKFGVKEGGMNGFRDKLRINLNRELKAALKLKNKNVVLNKLLDLNEFILPQSAIAIEIDHLKHDAMERYKEMLGNKAPVKNLPELPSELFKDQAERRVKLGILVRDIVNTYDLKADDANVRELIEEIATSYEYPEQIINWYYEDPSRLEQFEAVAIEDLMIAKLLETAKVKETQMDVEEVLKEHQGMQ